jgi:hypothetical protein
MGRSYIGIDSSGHCRLPTTSHTTTDHLLVNGWNDTPCRALCDERQRSESAKSHPSESSPERRSVLRHGVALSGSGGDGTDASSATENVLHSFGATGTDGIDPQGGLIQARMAIWMGPPTLAALSVFPGTNAGNGTVFKITL